MGIAREMTHGTARTVKIRHDEEIQFYVYRRMLLEAIAKS